MREKKPERDIEENYRKEQFVLKLRRLLPARKATLLGPEMGSLLSVSGETR